MSVAETVADLERRVGLGDSARVCMGELLDLLRKHGFDFAPPSDGLTAEIRQGFERRIENLERENNALADKMMAARGEVIQLRVERDALKAQLTNLRTTSTAPDTSSGATGLSTYTPPIGDSPSSVGGDGGPFNFDRCWVVRRTNTNPRRQYVYLDHDGEWAPSLNDAWLFNSEIEAEAERPRGARVMRVPEAERDERVATVIAGGTVDEKIALIAETMAPIHAAQLERDEAVVVAHLDAHAAKQEPDTDAAFDAAREG